MRFVRAMLLFGGSLFAAFASAADQEVSSSAASRAEREGEEPNGISVGRPKVFDGRTLTLMLEGLSENLRAIQVVDKTTLATALGYVQGFTARETVSNLSLTTAPGPSLQQQTVHNIGMDAASKPTAETTQQTTTTNQAAVAPTVPTLDTLPAFSGFTPSYGENSADLLSDQINLQYQIFNLRMVLDRSLSDRLSEGSPRLQAVLGFNVSVDPPATARDSVAVVEVTLHANVGKKGALSLVGLLPQEKTYNAATLSAKSNAFGLAAAAKIVQVGYARRSREQIFYLYRDADTIAYERMSKDNSGEITFGWMFRPVLGRRAVSSGFRQLFAVVALPGVDNAAQSLSASVHTYWKRFDRESSTSYEPRDATRGHRFLYGASLGLARPEIFTRRYHNYAEYSEIQVLPTGAFQDYLGPQITNAWWERAGPKTAVVSVNGRNFFTGTQVSLGDKTYAAVADGFTLKSSEAFDLTLPIDALVSGPGVVSGRYGVAVPLVAKERTAPQEYDAIELDSARLGPVLSGVRKLELFLHAVRNGADEALLESGLPVDPGGHRIEPIIAVGGKSFAHEFVGNNRRSTPSYVAYVPSDQVASGQGIVSITWPFRGAHWTSTNHFYDPASVYDIARVNSKSIVIATRDPLRFTINPEEDFDDKGVYKPRTTEYCWSVLLGAPSTNLSTNRCHSNVANTSRISDSAVVVTLDTEIPEKVVLVSPHGAMFMLSVPKGDSAKADSKETSAIALKQYDSVWIDLPLEHAADAQVVEANHVLLKSRLPASAKDPAKATSLQVQISQEVTAKPGTIDVSVLDKDGKLMTTARVQVSCRDCTGETK